MTVANSVKPLSILILDPDDQCCAETIEAFASRGWMAHHVHSFMDALELVPNHYYNIAIIEMMLPDMMGTDAWNYIRKLSPRTLGIITTASRSLHRVINAGERGILSFLLKPFDTSVLCDLIAQAAESQRLELENERAETQLARLGTCLSAISRAPSEQIISKALAQIPGVWIADWTVIYLLNTDRSWTPHWVSHDSLAPEGDWYPSNPELLEPWMAQALESGHPVALGIPGESDSAHPVPGSNEYNLGSCVIVPLRGSDKNYGVLTVINRANSEQPLTGREVELVKVVAESITGALEHAQAARRLAEDSILDAATASYTAAFLDRVLMLENARHNRYNHPFSLLLLNLAGVGQFYQARGEKLARQVVHDAAQFVQGQLRRADVLAHLADQQFAILLPETNWADAQQVARRLAEILQTRLLGDLAEPRPELMVQVVAPSEEALDLSGLLGYMPRPSELDG